MLKYQNYQVVFQEIPDETSLAIAIGGCRIHCVGCHSQELWEDKGESLDIRHLDALLDANRGVTCCLLLGGEHNLDALTKLFMYLHKKIKTAWYSGLDEIPKDKIGILDYLDFIKLGHYDHNLGGLDSPTTNQHLYQFSHFFSSVIPELGAGWKDITFKLQKHGVTKEVSQTQKLDRLA